MTMPDKHFKEKLYNLETPLSNRASFEAVMAMRGEKQAWGASRILLSVIGLLLAGGTAWALFNISPNKGEQKLAIEKQNTNGKSGESAVYSPASPSAPNEKTIGSQSGITVSGNQSNSVDKNALARGNSARHNSTKSAVSAIGNPEDKIAENDKKRDNPSVVKPDGQNQENGKQTQSDESAPDFAGIQGAKAGKLRSQTDLWFKLIAGLQMNYYNPEPSKTTRWIYEANAATAGTAYRNFDNTKSLSLRGNHHLAQYQALALVSAGNGLLFGAGAEYSAFQGTADYRQAFNTTVMDISSRQVAIIQPGLPVRYITVYDTTLRNVQNVVNGNVSYQYRQISVPFAFRYMLGQGSVLFRVSASLAPGIVTYKTGNMFDNSRYQSMEMLSSSHFTLSGRLGVGAHYQATRRIAIVAEPVLNYRGFGKIGSHGFNTMNYGFGLGLVYMP